MSQSQYVQQIPEKFREAFIKEKENRVAVLGSSEAWPMIHRICIDVAQCQYVAVTSRYIYIPSVDSKSGYIRVEQDHDKLKINDFLRDKVINDCGSAIIVYTPHATSYNEAEWCDVHKTRTLGINFTRTIHREGYCEDCIVDEGAGFSYCCGESNAETCVTRKPCPIKNSGMSKNQLDYFSPRNERMNLISMEKLDKTLDIVRDFLGKELNLPNKLVHVFEFRVDLSKAEYEKVDRKLKKLCKENEDRFNSSYEYTDYYYKPTTVTVEEWLNKKHSLRIRRFLNQVRENPIGSVYYSQVEQTAEGFYYKQSFGGISWFEGSLDTAQNWLKEMGMECFLQTIKNGKYAYIHQQKVYDTKIKVFIEEIKVMGPSNEPQPYGYSLEIEIWTDKPQDMIKISQKKTEILKHLELETCPQKLEPVQEFIYNFIAKQF